MDLKSRNLEIELTTSREDWTVIRECYVQSFRRYPLYKYMVPDESKREEFLRAYLDANYEVTVGSGQGILIVVKLVINGKEGMKNNTKELESNRLQTTHSKVIGGVLFVPPSEDGCGWAIGSDEPYWEAYEKYGLARISKEGYERVIRYEAWENDNICRKAAQMRMPLWNGLFCAISPEYASTGVGTIVYKEAIRIMAQYWVEKQKMSINTKSPFYQSQSQEKNSIEQKVASKLKSNEEANFNKIKRDFSYQKFENDFTLRRALSLTKKETFISSRGNTRLQVPERLDTSHTAPLVVAVSHNDKAAHFHEANGFYPVSKMPFHDKIEGATPFNTHVLVLDPFSTGRVSEFISGLHCDDTSEGSSLLLAKQLYKSLQHSQPIEKVLV